MEDTWLLKGTEIGDCIDLDSTDEYPCSDGSWTLTIDVMPLLEAQLKKAEIKAWKIVNSGDYGKGINFLMPMILAKDETFSELKRRARSEIFKELNKYRQANDDMNLHFVLSRQEWQALKLKEGGRNDE